MLSHLIEVFEKLRPVEQSDSDDQEQDADQLQWRQDDSQRLVPAQPVTMLILVVSELVHKFQCVALTRTWLLRRRAPWAGRFLLQRERRQRCARRQERGGPGGEWRCPTSAAAAPEPLDTLGGGGEGYK